MKKILGLLIFISIPVTLIGYFLQTILIPIADYDLLTDSDIFRIQQETSLNYPVGTFMLYLGSIMFIFSSLILIIIKVQEFFKKNR